MLGLGALLLLQLLLVLWHAPGTWRGIAGYAPLHTLMETLSIGVAALVISVGWSARLSRTSSVLLLISSAFVGVALLDFSHMLSFPGMPDYVTPAHVEKAINFWLVARLLAAGVLLHAALAHWERTALPWQNLASLGLVLLGVGLTHWLFLYRPIDLPRTFVAGQGLTAFKVGQEYFIIALNLVAAVVLLWRMRAPLGFNAPALLGAVLTMAMSEFFFTLYADATDVYNLAGHLYKVVAYYYLYRIIFRDAVERPYADMDAARANLKATLAAVPDLVFEMDAQGVYWAYHSPSRDQLAAPPEVLLGRHVSAVMPEASAQVVMEVLQEAVQRGQSRGHLMELPLPGGVRTFELTASRKDAVSTGTPRVIVLSRDVTAQVQDARALQDALQYNQTILDSMGDALVTIGADGLIRSFNKSACALFGYTQEEILGRNVALLMPEPHRSKHDNYLARYVNTGVARILGKPRDVDAQRKDGSVFPISLSITRTSHHGETTFVGLIRDITQRRKDEEEIRRLAYYDGLTGLPNRRLLSDHLRHALVASRRSEFFGAVMFLDLDHFKLINDTLGHAVGDELLRQVGARLTSAMREGDTVARLGGDEFVLVLENLSRERQDAITRAEGVARKVLSVLAAPFFLGAQQQTSSTSIGVVVFVRDEKSVDDLLKEADAALYQAKGAGRNRFCFYDPEMLASHIARSQLEEDIRRGLAAGEFSLHYQLQVDAHQRAPIGAEALIRWRHPTRGMVPPNQFIPLAEECGLILPLGQWVLETACAELRRWAQHPAARHLSLAINVSAAQFAQADFVDRVQRVLQTSGAPPDKLKIELTESALAANLDEVIARMGVIRRMGVHFALDDFGTGYSSLTYLKRLPLDQIKIDQSFVRDLLTDESDASIARTITALGRSLNLSVIAEGVETEGQRAILEGMGCQAYQGYLFGRPIPAEYFLLALG